MKWFKRMLVKWVREVECENINRAYPLERSSLQELPEARAILGFKIYSAQNGQILEFQRYDKQTDRISTTVYLVDQNEDIAEYVTKCLSLEMFKR